MNAQASLGNLYATGDSSVPIDLAKSVAWYRRAAERGERVFQYELGFSLLLGEEGSKNIDEGLMWLERAAELGSNEACKLLADCYENGSFDVPLDAAKVALWRDRLEEYERLHRVRTSDMRWLPDLMRAVPSHTNPAPRSTNPRNQVWGPCK